MIPTAKPVPVAAGRSAWSWQRLVTALVAASLVITVALGAVHWAEPAGSELTWSTDTGRFFQSPGKRFPIEAPQSARVKPVPHPRMPYA